MRPVLHDILFWGLTAAPWLNIVLVGRLAWAGRRGLATLLAVLVGAGCWLLYALLAPLLVDMWAGDGVAAEARRDLTLWAVGVALFVIFGASAPIWKGKPDG